MESQFKQGYAGTRWRLLAPEFHGVAKQGVTEVQRALQRFLSYVLPVDLPGEIPTGSSGHIAVAGTAEAPVLRELISRGVIPRPGGREGYSVFLGPSPWNPPSRLLAVAGSDAAGVLYGSQEVAARLSLEGNSLDGFSARQQFLDNAPDFSVAEKPAIARRGIWCWGYTVYCYRALLEKMARLKLNMLVIWNDRAPLNIGEVIAAAHERNIQVILGLHCGWGHEGSLDLSRDEDRAAIVGQVMDTYREQYAQVTHDGIYFQTLTEHSDRRLSGASTASWVRKLINEVAQALHAHHPGLRIEFGIHATSIGEDDRDLRTVDSRVELVWEDCGSMPFAYTADRLEDFDKTLDWSRRLAALRPGSEFAMVAKGWPFLRWMADFENHEGFILGERSMEWVRQRLEARRAEWDKVNVSWLRSFPWAAKFYREMLEINPMLSVAGLVEDGMLEAKAQLSVALFAETLWNPHRNDDELLTRAARPFLNF